MNGNRTGPRGNRSRTRNTPLTRAAVLDGVAEVELATYDGAEEFEHGLDILLTGFDSALSPPRAHP
ncbi:hypothetical protein IU501_05855 [Nocardia otitidiscaviarum]|uniref:hypothetical protein n=1 Tax=Nocardia otitidiscaviarum TaxID=1823 RepID=UPI001894C10A|nr:hypothetical protein [Nocardia otitidiscaviarum]MBF6132522.1 hypothetical protein [Nocardia otitidiscaviarum]